MGALTEAEIFDCLAENLRTAAEDCRLLAWHPRRGFVYDRFRKSLKLVEGACRQAYYWRNYDSRWLTLGLKMEEAHRRAGDWMRGYPMKDDRKIAHPLFQKLADVLEEAYRQTERVRTMATGRVGPIMPAMGPGPHRDTRPVQVITPGGIILPPSWRDQGLRRRAGT